MEATKPEATKKTKNNSHYILKLEKGKFLSTLNEDIIDVFAEHDRVLLNARPGTGKTSMVSDWFASRDEIPFRKIVFMSPLLVIQEQFKSDVKMKGGWIDLELNYKSHQIFESGDKNITSTYKSLFKIANHLTEKDLIVVDEAHTLLKAFRKGKKVDVYADTSLILRRTKARILFLSATPGETLKDVFKYKELKIDSSKHLTKVEFHSSEGNIINFAMWFAKRAIKRQGSDALNIIYLNSKKKIDDVEHILKNEGGYSCAILHSDTKSSTNYEELITHAKIDKNVQFLLTTSIISAGANIQNDNIGEALIFKNHDPVDLFQFSKRFRNKMNMRLTLVNPFKWERYTYSSKEELMDEIKPIRDYYETLLDELEELEDIDHDRNYHNDDIGTKSDLMMRTMTRLMIEEARHKEKLNERFKKKEKLQRALSYLNFEIKEGYQPDFNDYQDYNEMVKKANQKKFNRFIQKFEANLEDYICALRDFAKNDEDYIIREEFDKNEHLLTTKNMSAPEDVHEDVADHFFIRNIIKPFLEYLPYFNDKLKTVSFLKKTPQSERDRESIKHQLYFNDIFHRYFDQSESNKKPQKVKNINYQELSFKEKQAVTFVEATIKWFENNPYYASDKFYLYIKQEVKMKNPKLVNDFPFEALKVVNSKDKDGYALKEIKSTFLKNLFYGIFYTNPKRKQQPSRGLPKNIYVPFQNLDNIKDSNSINLKRWDFKAFKYQKTRHVDHTYFVNPELIVDCFSQN